MNDNNNLNWALSIINKYCIDMIVIYDKNRRIHHSTPQFDKAFGIGPEIKGNIDVFERIHPEDREYIKNRFHQAVLNQRNSQSEYRIIDKDGNIRYWESKTSIVAESGGNFTVVSTRDITERKKMETELEYRKKRYQVLQNSLKVFSQELTSVMKLSDLEGKLIQEISKIIEGSNPILFKYNKSKQDTVKLEFEKYLPYLPNLIMGKLVNADKKSLINIGEQLDISYIILIDTQSICEEMDIIWLETLVYYSNMVFKSLNVIENLLNQIELSLQSKEIPVWILRLLFSLSEKERLNLSADLHDTVLQDLISLYRKLGAILNQFDFESYLTNELKNIEDGILDIIHQIRMTCNELRPPLLTELGLERSLENLFNYTQVNSTYKIYFTATNTSRLSINEEQTISIYRITQELLNNATKHSKASNVYFNIYMKDEALFLEYCDDGIGFDLESIRSVFTNVGIPGIIQRVRSLSGSVKINSKPNDGMTLSIGIPCNMLSVDDSNF